MMKVTLKDIVESQEVMRTLSNKPLRGRVAFKVARLLKKLEAELTTFNDTRVKLIESYAKKDEEGNYVTNDKNEYQFDQDNANKFVEEINKLLLEELDVDANPILVDEIEDLDFTPAEMAALEPFMDE
ncbi:MAG: hypothetical protein IKR04_06985 [Clostridia bacterium]|nr:hypothetical protein [Clostridia bacterium]